MGWYVGLRVLRGLREKTGLIQLLSLGLGWGRVCCLGENLEKKRGQSLRSVNMLKQSVSLTPHYSKDTYTVYF